MAPLLDQFNTDVAVLQEVARPERESEYCLWFGHNPRQGIGVVSREPYRLRALPRMIGVPRYTIPIEVTGPTRAVGGDLAAAAAQPDAARCDPQTWEELFAKTRGGGARSYIDWLDAAERDGTLALTIRAFISESITPEERESYAHAVASALGRRPETVHIAIVEIPTSTYQVAKAKKEAEAITAPEPESAGSRFQRAAQEILAQLAASRLPPGAMLLDSALATGSGPPVATIVYLAPAGISDDARALVLAGLREQLDLPTLDLRLVHIPVRPVIPFDRRGSTLDDASAASLAALAASVRPRAALRVVIQTTTNEAFADRRIDAIRNALVAAGVDEARIATSVSDAVDNDQAILLVERTTAPPV